MTRNEIVHKAAEAHASKMRETFPARFWSNVDKNGPVPVHRPKLGRCWIWTGWIERNGYGRVKRSNVKMGAHRAAYELAFGTIPKGDQVLHKCDNKRCQRPSHLFLGGSLDNVLDSVKKGRWGAAKLKPADVKTIRKLSNSVPWVFLAKRFNVSVVTIEQVHYRQRWSCVA